MIVGSPLLSVLDLGLLIGMACHSTTLGFCAFDLSKNMANTQNDNKTHFCLKVPFCTEGKADSLRTPLTAQQKAFNAHLRGV